MVYLCGVMGGPSCESDPPCRVVYVAGEGLYNFSIHKYMAFWSYLTDCVYTWKVHVHSTLAKRGEKER